MATGQWKGMAHIARSGETPAAGAVPFGHCPRRAHRCSHLLPPTPPLLPAGFQRRNFEGAPEVACDLFGRRGAEAGAELLGEWAEPWLEQ